MEELIKYFEKELELKLSDLVMSDKDRWYKTGQVEMLEEIKEILEKGYPNG